MAQTKTANNVAAQALSAALPPRVVAGELMPRSKRRGTPANLTNQGKGRPKGSRNKFTIEAKQAIADCFADIGGRKAFAAWARGNRTKFYGLYAKLLPIQLQGTGKDGEFVIHITADEAKV